MIIDEDNNISFNLFYIFFNFNTKYYYSILIFKNKNIIKSSKNMSSYLKEIHNYQKIT